MIAIVFLFIRMLCDCFKPRGRLEVEIAGPTASAQCPWAACATPTRFC